MSESEEKKDGVGATGLAVREEEIPAEASLSDAVYARQDQFIYSNKQTISVIVPVYNAEAYLDECVRSILSQSYPHIELLLIDDGSTDGSAALCDDWASRDARVRVLHKENGGVSAARNAGLEAAQGDWIGFCDCDDYLLPGMYEKLLSVAGLSNGDSSNGSDILICTVADEQADGSLRQVDTGNIRAMSGQDAICELLTGMGAAAEHRETIWFSVWNKLYRRALFESVRFDPATDSAEDVPVNLALFSKAESVLYFEKPFYYWRHRSDSQSNAHAPKALLAATETSRVLLDYASALPPEQRGTGVTAAFRHFIWYYTACATEIDRLRRAGEGFADYLALRGELQERLRAMKHTPGYAYLNNRFKIAVVLMLNFPNLFSTLWLSRKRRKDKENR